MPLYEYECPTCGRFELIKKFSDEPVTTCPTCGKDVKKLLSSPAIQFKGSGWYITDYARKGGGGGSSEAGKSEGTKSGGTDSGSSEGKSESSKAESKSDSSKSDSTPTSSTSK